MTRHTTLKRSKLDSAVRAYADRLMRILQAMGCISHPGATLSRSQFHSPIQLQRCSVNPAVSSTTALGSSLKLLSMNADHVRLLPPMPELEVMKVWLSESPRPLVLLAPFGTGKSVVIETFCFEMARQIQTCPAGTIPRFVPLPVQLRSWHWNEHSARKREPFLDFLFRSQKLLVSEYDTAGLLTGDHIALLLEEGRLVPFFDGLDELPDAFSNSTQTDARSAALTDITALCKRCHFAVSSRPGYSAEKHFPIETIYTVCDFEPSTIRRFVDKYNSSVSGLGFIDHSGRFDLHPFLSTLLKRPLFLSAWCTRQVEARLTPPRSLNAVMDQLLVRTFDPIKMQEQSQAKDTIMDSKHLLASLLLPFAETLYGDTFTRDELLRQCDDTCATYTNATPHNAIRWLEKAGLIEPVGSTEYRAFKVPLTEYLVGWHLAELTNLGRDGERKFIRLFRRWVWHPELHDTLDFAFSALWCGTEPQIELAATLLDWMVLVGKCDHTRAHQALDSAIACRTQDDLTFHFANTALRWHSLNPKPRELPVDIAIELGMSLSLGMPRSVIHQDTVSDESRFAADHQIEFSLSSELLCQLFSAVRKAPQFCSSSTFDRKRLVEKLAKRVSEQHAASLVVRWINDHGNLRHDRETQRCLRWAICGAARRIDEDSAEKLLSQLLAICSNEDDSETRWDWTNCVGSVASRVPAEAVARLIQLCVERCQLESEVERLEPWRTAALSIAMRVPQQSAASLIEEYLRCEEHVTSRERDMFHIAIIGAISNVPEESVYPLAMQFIIKSGDFNDNSWGTAIATAASVVHPRYAERMVRDLMALPVRESKDTEASILVAIQAAALRVPESSSFIFVTNLVNDFSRTPNDELMRHRFFQATHVAQRLPEECASRLIHDLLAQHNDPLTSEDSKQLLRYTIVKATSRVAEKDAAQVLRQLVAAHLKPHIMQDELNSWRAAIHRVASRLPASDALNAVIAWKTAYIKTAKDDEFRRTSEKVCRAAALAARGSDIQHVCEELISIGSTDVAFNIVVASPEFAILSNCSRTTECSKIVSFVQPPFTVVLRCTLTFDDTLAVAPHRVRELLNEAGDASVNGAALVSEKKGFAVPLDKAADSSHQREARELASAETNSQEGFSNPYIFRRRTNAIWEVAFDSEPQLLGFDRKGFDYLVKILSQPNAPLSPLELSEGCASPDESLLGKESFDDVADAETVRAVIGRRNELKMRIAQAEDSLASRELAEIEDYLRRIYRPGGQLIKLGTPRIKRASQSVAVAIKRAIDVIESAGQKRLACHLRECVQVDNYMFIYRDKSARRWCVE